MIKQEKARHPSIKFKAEKICRLRYLEALAFDKCQNDNCQKCTWFEPREKVIAIAESMDDATIRKNLKDALEFYGES